MKAMEALRKLAGVTAGQWGMVTTAQAAQVGVSRLHLARLADAGHLRRLSHGIYLDAGVPETPLDDLRAAWLSAEPTRFAEVRLGDGPDGIVIAGASAASLHRVGDLRADRHDFVSPRRRQSRRPEVRFRQRTLDPADVTIVAGLPVMTTERTIADLIDDIGDLSLAADALRDASRHGLLDEEAFTRLLGPFAARYGLASGDGSALLARLKSVAGIDAAAVAGRIAADAEVGPLVAAGVLGRLDSASFDYLARLPAVQSVMRAISEQASQTATAAVQPLVDAADAVGRDAVDAWVRASGVDRITELLSQQISEQLLAPDVLKTLTTAIGDAVHTDTNHPVQHATPVYAGRTRSRG